MAEQISVEMNYGTIDRGKDNLNKYGFISKRLFKPGQRNFKGYVDLFINQRLGCILIYAKWTRLRYCKKLHHGLVRLVY